MSHITPPIPNQAFACGVTVFDIANPEAIGTIFAAGPEVSEVKFEGGRYRNVPNQHLRAAGVKAEVDGAATPAFNWRAHLRVHPAGKLFPLLSETNPAALKQLAENIKVNGLIEPIVGWASGEGQFLLDGSNRLDALAQLGLLYETADHHVGVKKWDGKQWTDRPDDRIEGWELFRHLYEGRDGDPYEIALSLNVHRRHLTNEQKRDLIEKVLKAKPETSNRQIAAATKVDHKTVSEARRKAEATGEIPQLEKTVGADGKARPVKTKKSISITVPPTPIKTATDAEPVAEPAVPIPTQAGTTLDSAIQSEWREAIHAFEILTSHTPEQVATAISPEGAPLVTEIANYFAKLVKLICPADNGEAPPATNSAVEPATHNFAASA